MLSGGGNSLNCGGACGSSISSSNSNGGLACCCVDRGVQLGWWVLQAWHTAGLGFFLVAKAANRFRRLGIRICSCARLRSQAIDGPRNSACSGSAADLIRVSNHSGELGPPASLSVSPRCWSIPTRTSQACRELAIWKIGVFDLLMLGICLKEA